MKFIFNSLQKIHIGLILSFKKWNYYLPSFGHISFAAFFIAILSGIWLALGYNVQKPQDSLQLLNLINPYGHWIRSLHYWSAQIFLVTFFIHFFEHLIKKGYNNLSFGIWVRLTISIVFAFFVMLSGFMLKGDADAQLAIRILTGLLEKLPSGKPFFTLSILGHDYQILYMHHLATTTIFLYLIIIEHVRKVWPTFSSIVWTFFLSLIFIFLWPLTLTLPSDLIAKGPWYFLALQEFLHWLSYPIMFWLFIIFILLIIAFLPKFSPKILKISQRLIYVIIILYILLTWIGWSFRGQNWQWVWP